MRARILLTVFVIAAIAAGCTELKKRAGDGFGGRDRWQQPERVMQSLAILPGDAVADLGAGGGYFTFFLADATGPKGRVYAVDIDSAKLRDIDAESERKGYGNVRTILAEVSDPKLPADGVDLIFSSNTFHHLVNRVDYFDRVKRYLKPGGRIAIIDYKGDGDHATPVETIRTEMTRAGYRLDERFEFLEKQNFQIFSLPES